MEEEVEEARNQYVRAEPADSNGCDFNDDLGDDMHFGTYYSERIIR